MKEDEVYKGMIIETDVKKCKINREKRILKIIKIENLDENKIDISIDSIKINSSICLCGHIIKNGYILTINKKVNILLGSECIKYFEDGKETLNNYLRKTFYCENCNKNVKKHEVNKNGLKFKHNCNFKICKSCYINFHKKQFKYCYNCYIN